MHWSTTPPEGYNVLLLLGPCRLFYPLLGAIVKDINVKIVLVSYECKFTLSSIRTPWDRVSWNKVCPLFSWDAAKRPPYKIEYFGSVWNSFVHVLSRAVCIFLCWSFRGVDNHVGGSIRRLCAIASMHARNRQCPSLGMSITWLTLGGMTIKT